MRCLNEKEWIEYWDGEKSAEEKAQIQTHLGKCMRCQTVSMETRKNLDKMFSVLTKLNPDQVPRMPALYTCKRLKRNFFLRLIRFGVRLPFPALIATMAMIIGLTIEVARQHREIRRLSPNSISMKVKKNTLMITRGNIVHEIPFEGDLSGYLPMADPKVFVVSGGR